MHRNDAVASVLTYRDAFTAAECTALREQSGTLGLADVDIYPEPAVPVRRASTRLLEDSEFDWVRERLLGYARSANGRFALELRDEIRPVMAVTYPTGGFFGWHTDLGDGDESTRKISITVQLTDPADYEGGELQIVSHDRPMPRGPAGTLIAFPAHLAHRVLPVGRGTREALVAWVHGPSFR